MKRMDNEIKNLKNEWKMQNMVVSVKSDNSITNPNNHKEDREEAREKEKERVRSAANNNDDDELFDEEDDEFFKEYRQKRLQEIQKAK